LRFSAELSPCLMLLHSSFEARETVQQSSTVLYSTVLYCTGQPAMMATCLRLVACCWWRAGATRMTIDPVSTRSFASAFADRPRSRGSRALGGSNGLRARPRGRCSPDVTTATLPVCRSSSALGIATTSDDCQARGARAMSAAALLLDAPYQALAAGR
jgi:hypothetical protein